MPLKPLNTSYSEPDNRYPIWDPYNHIPFWYFPGSAQPLFSHNSRSEHLLRVLHQKPSWREPTPEKQTEEDTQK
jgi:hypothetical protein